MVRTLLGEHENLSSGPQQPHKKLGMAIVQACNPSTVRDRDRRIAEGVLAISLTRFSERPFLKGILVESDGIGQLRSSSTFYCRPAPVAYTRTLAHTHSQNSQIRCGER